jgi:RNA polymerase-binding transcription factor DksA
VDSNAWLTREQIAQLRAALLRAREELAGQADDGRSRNALRLGLVESALTRLQNGTYGECVACEEPLAYSLLAQRPEQPFCPECEQERRRTVNARSAE